MDHRSAVLHSGGADLRLDGEPCLRPGSVPEGQPEAVEAEAGQVTADGQRDAFACYGLAVELTRGRAQVRPAQSDYAEIVVHRWTPEGTQESIAPLSRNACLLLLESIAATMLRLK